jgi:hypothetical protein
MGDAAHAESLNHEVYCAPLTVQPEFEYRKTPENYAQRYPGPGKLPDQMKVWLVQKTGKPVGGVVARGEGFTDSPDAEVLASGFNIGKAYGDVGIGRHGNFLQWGYSAPPSQMTEAGRKLFLNCIHYIRKFDGQAPLSRRKSSTRTEVVAWAGAVARIHADQRKEYFLLTFPEELYEKYHADPNGWVAYYRTNIELIYYDKVYRVDDELTTLGLACNRTIGSLHGLIDLLDDPRCTPTARKLLSRYTDRTFETPQQWRQWFDENKNRLYFTDTGGYKFKVVPEGYLTGDAAKK